MPYNPYGNNEPHFVINDVMDLQRKQIQLQRTTNETLLVQIQKEQNTNALLAERLNQAEKHNKELQEKLDAEIAKNDRTKKIDFIKGIIIAICGAIGFEVCMYMFKILTQQ